VVVITSFGLIALLPQDIGPFLQYPQSLILSDIAFSIDSEVVFEVLNDPARLLNNCSVVGLSISVLVPGHSSAMQQIE
jgi:hypothetical protein